MTNQEEQDLINAGVLADMINALVRQVEQHNTSLNKLIDMVNKHSKIIEDLDARVSQRYVQ